MAHDLARLMVLSGMLMLYQSQEMQLALFFRTVRLHERDKRRCREGQKAENILETNNLKVARASMVFTTRQFINQ